MMNTNEIDWNEVGNGQGGMMDGGNSSATSKEKSAFLKLKAGFHHLRLVPTGNQVKKTFYLEAVQHPVRVPKDDGSGWVDQFVLCWSWMLNDLMKLKDDPQAQKTKTYVSYLGSVKAINQEEFTKYQTYGCPFCKIFNRLNELGVDNETKNKFYPKRQFFFNAIWRDTNFSGQPASGDGDVYIWRTSKTIGESITNTIKTMMQQGGVNYVDINTGKDILLQATGEKLARRYPTCQFVDRGTPLNLGEKIPHNLLDILAVSNKEYQKAVNYIKASYGSLLMQYGYAIPGDTALTQYGQAQQAAVDATNKLIAQVNNPSQATPVNVLVQKTTEVAEQWQAQNSESDPSFQPGDQIVEKDGKLFNMRTGKYMF